MSVKRLTEHKLMFLSLKGGCTGLLESTLVKMPHCRKSHVTAYLFATNLPYFIADSYILEDFENAFFALFLQSLYAIEKLLAGFNVLP